MTGQARNQVVRGKKPGAIRVFLRRWLTWDPWLVAAYRDRIDYRSFSDNPDPHSRISEADKDQIIADHYPVILQAIKANTQENPYKKTTLHFAGKACVYLLAISSAFSLSGMVTSHIPFGAGDAILREIVAWFFFGASYLAHLIIFGKSVPRVAEKLLYVGKESDGKNKGWHFKKKYELLIHRRANNTVETGYYNSETGEYNQSTDDNHFSTNEQTIGICMLVFVIAVATVTSTLSVTKAIPSMEGMLLLSLMSLGPIFLPLGFACAAASFVCSVGLLLDSVIKLLKKPNKLDEFYKLFYWSTPGDPLTFAKVAQNGLTVVVMIGVCALVGLGMYGSTQVEAQDFMELIKRSQATAALWSVLGCALVGKFIFTVQTTVNLLLLGGRACNVAASWAWGGLKHLILGSDKPKDEDLQVYSYRLDPNRPEEQHTLLQDASVAVNALSQPAKTTQTPDIVDGQLGDSPFLHGSGLEIAYVWAMGLGATFRSAGAAMKDIKAYEPPSTKNLMQK